MQEDKLAKELEAYRVLAKSDKKVDLAKLALNVLEQHEDNILPDKQKRWAYLISLIVPPFGLIFAVKFYLSGKDDGEQAAWICGALTAVGILLLILFAKVILTGSGANLNQLQQINPSDIQQLYQ
jgi:hypothetical protein